MELSIHTHGNDKQKECIKAWIDSDINDIVYGGSKGSGKSFIGCTLIFGDALIYPNTHYFIARKKLTDLRKYTIPSIYEVFELWGLDKDQYLKYNGQDNYFTLYNGSKVYLLDAKYLPSDPQYYRFGSMQMTRGWIEEAGEFEEEAKANLFASVGRWKNDVYGLSPKLLQTCNPAKNYLYYGYYLPKKKGELEPHKAFIQALPQDNKMLPKGYIDNLHKILSTNEKKRLLYGDWEYDDDPNKLMDYDSICNIFNNDIIPNGETYISCDVARFGDDKTVIGVWSGLRLEKIVTLKQSGVNDVVDAINQLRREYRVSMNHIVIDEDGVGGGVKDYLRGSKGFVNNSKPIKVNRQQQNFNNLKSQCYFKLAELINTNKLYVNCNDNSIVELITQELEVVRAKEIVNEVKLSIESKDKVKELIGRSPDYSDMMAMRMFFELKGNSSTYSFNK